MNDGQRGSVEEGAEDAGAQAQEPGGGTTAPRGRLDLEDPLLRTGLALAGANARRGPDGEDGLLTGVEAARLNLRGTQLVVLSACETGIGELGGREGVYGLRRALSLAGAQSQLVSLWKVDDQGTAALMDRFYERLAAGEPRAQALQSAQRALRAQPATAHPFYWAAFQLIGDWEPLVLR